MRKKRGNGEMGGCSNSPDAASRLAALFPRGERAGPAGDPRPGHQGPRRASPVPGRGRHEGTVHGERRGGADGMARGSGAGSYRLYCIYRKDCTET